MHTESICDRQLSSFCQLVCIRFKGGIVMRDNVLWRKQSHIIMMLAESLQIDVERALDLFYSTKTYQQLATPKYGLQLMSDPYILENVLDELKES